MNSHTRLPILLVILTAGQLSAATQTFTNSAGITIGDSGAPPTLANPYPSAINVAGISGTIVKLTVTLTGFTHTFPGDVELLLVAPDGKQAVIMSDVGGSEDLSGVTITLDDDAGAFMTTSGLTTGTYRPTNGSGIDSFPAPAPVAGDNVALSTFKGISPTGVWSLYVVDDATGDFGTIGSWSLNITTPSPANSGELVISEFRVRGPNGANDEFIEIQNATGIDHVVQSIDGSSGYALAASNGVARFVIPNGTVIPAGGHYLGVNSVGYSLSSYPAGNGTTATGNATYTTDIPDNAGIALFRTSTAANFNLANRLDAVGSTSEPSTLYKEGTGYQALTPFSIDYSFYRDLRVDGVKDTQNNFNDFVFVDSNGTSAGAGQRLGVPGPENLTSPIRRSTGPALVRRLVDPAVASSGAPHRIRDFTSSSVTNSTFGTFSLRRKFVNNTGASLTRLRFRIVEISTFPAPSGTADLRMRTCSDVTVPLTAGGNATVRGTTLEQPPSQPNGGAFNSTVSVGVVTNASPLLNGASIDVQFLFGIQQTGAIKLAIIPETLPASAAGIWFINADTDNFAVENETFSTAITSVVKGASNVNVNHLTATGVLFQMQRSLDLATWTDIGVAIPGSGAPETFIHAAAANQSKQFYRLKEVK